MYDKIHYKLKKKKERKKKKGKVPIGTLVYFWAFYLVPLIYISVFVPVPYWRDDYSFVG